MEFPLAIVTLGTILGIAEPLLNKKKHESLNVWPCLGVNPLDMSRTPYWASEAKHSQKTYHALSPHPHVISTSFISSMDCTVLSYYIVT